ncbi:MAG: DUF2500 domain-containing protein [Paenibacillus sp.]|nr:DUF2500 domain-containing protein [Paenibacillus sp.]
MHNYSEPDGFFGFISEMPLFFQLFGGFVFTIVFGSIFYAIIKGLKTSISNNAAAVIKQRCKIVDKRSEVWGGSGDSSASTNYYITFEFEDSSRVELHVKSNYFGLITVGDQGELTYQGTRFKEFTRQLSRTN